MPSLLGVFIFILVGFALGWFFRGVREKGLLGQLRNEQRAAEITTKIERERLEQDRMIGERMK